KCLSLSSLDHQLSFYNNRMIRLECITVNVLDALADQEVANFCRAGSESPVGKSGSGMWSQTGLLAQESVQNHRVSINATHEPAVRRRRVRDHCLPVRHQR